MKTINKTQLKGMYAEDTHIADPKKRAEAFEMFYANHLK